MPASKPPLSVVFAVTATAMMGNALLAAAAPEIVDHFDQPVDRIGLIFTVVALPGIVVAPLVGHLADRFGRKRVLVPCLIVFGIGGSIGALAPNFPIFLATRFFMGIGAAGLINLSLVIIADAWTGNERSKLIGQNSAVVTICLAIFPLSGGVLTELFGWRGPFLPFVLVFGVAGLVARRLVDNVEVQPVAIGPQYRRAAGVVKAPLVYSTLLLGMVLFMIIFGVFLGIFAEHLETTFGYRPSVRGAIIAAPALTSTIAALSLGRLRLRISVQTIVYGGLAAFAVSLALIGATKALPLLFLGVFIYGLGEGSMIPTLQDVIASEAPEAVRATVMAIWVGFVRAGQALGPAVAGAMLRWFSTGEVMIASGLFAAAVCGITALGRPFTTIAAPDER